MFQKKPEILSLKKVEQLTQVYPPISPKKEKPYQPSIKSSETKIDLTVNVDHEFLKVKDLFTHSGGKPVLEERFKSNDIMWI